MGDIERLIDYEKSQLGNTGEFYNYQYYGFKNSAAYCVIFQWHCFKACGLSGLFYGGGKTASCNSLYNYHKSQAVNRDYKQGDLILFTFNKYRTIEHVGLCIESNKDYIVTIDGNTTQNGIRGIVAQKERDINTVVCAIRPNYKEVKMEEFRWLKDIDEKYKAACEKAYRKGILSLSEAGAVDITSDNLQVVLWLDRLGLLE